MESGGLWAHRVNRVQVGVVIITMIVAPSAGKTVDVVLADYHNYTELMDELYSLVDSYRDISRLYILGTTVEERDLPVIQISQGVQLVS